MLRYLFSCQTRTKLMERREVRMETLVLHSISIHAVSWFLCHVCVWLMCYCIDCLCVWLMCYCIDYVCVNDVFLYLLFVCVMMCPFIGTNRGRREDWGRGSDRDRDRGRYWNRDRDSYHSRSIRRKTWSGSREHPRTVQVARNIPQYCSFRCEEHSAILFFLVWWMPSCHFQLPLSLK